MGAQGPSCQRARASRQVPSRLPPQAKPEQHPISSQGSRSSPSEGGPTVMNPCLLPITRELCLADQPKHTADRLEHLPVMNEDILPKTLHRRYHGLVLADCFYQRHRCSHPLTPVLSFLYKECLSCLCLSTQQRKLFSILLHTLIHLPLISDSPDASSPTPLTPVHDNHVPSRRLS